MSVKLALFAVALLAGCHADAEPQRKHGVDMAAPELQWRRYDLGTTGVSVEFLTEPPLQHYSDERGQYLLQMPPGLELFACWGACASLPDWRRTLLEQTPDAKLAPPTAVRVCNVEAIEQRAEVPAHGRSEALVRDARGNLSHHYQDHPARSRVVVSFKRGNVPILVSFAVDQQQRLAHAEVERRFLASVQCR